MKKIFFTIICLLILGGAGCENPPQQIISRQSKIPTDAVKMAPETDFHPPILHSGEYEQPVPLEGPINTAGAEDSAFYAADRNEFYFFFTPDPGIPVEDQLLDGVTGIYVSQVVDGVFQKPERVFLQKQGKLALDGCEFVQGDTMWFCSVREGYTDVNLFRAEFKGGRWQDWEYLEKLNQEYNVGEMHISQDKTEMYFHRPSQGEGSDYDIFVSRFENGEWQEPESVGAVNSLQYDGWPYLTPDGNELWFTRTYQGSPAIYRSIKIGSEWQKPELIISQFAGEPNLDSRGNIYFTHHYYDERFEMIEADIYVARKK